MGGDFDDKSTDARGPGPWRDPPPQATHEWGPWADPIAPTGPTGKPPSAIDQAAPYQHYGEDKPAAPPLDPRRERPLLASDYKNVDELKKAIEINYVKDGKDSHVHLKQGKIENRLAEKTFSEQQVAQAKAAFDNKDRGPAMALADRDLWQARDIYRHREELAGIQMLSVRDKDKPREGQVVIDDMAKQMLANMTGADQLSKEEKEAYKSMFSHMAGQALFTMQYGRQRAEMVGDMHERAAGERISGEIGKDQKSQTDAVDAYCDLINNVHGQNLGEKLKKQMGNPSSWTPEQTSAFFNAVQNSIAGSRGVEFKNFEKDDKNAAKFNERLQRLDGRKLLPAKYDE